MTELKNIPIRLQTFNNELEKLLIENDFNQPADMFRVLTSYMNNSLNEIEKTNCRKQTMALDRTTMYMLDDYFNLFKKMSEIKKKKNLFKLVNLLVIQTKEIKDVTYFRVEEEFQEILKFKETILKNKDWYIRVIPESEWLIKYIKESYE
jgi:hypothetical protein